MSSMTIRNLDPAVKEALKLRAARNGRSVQQEVRLILSDVVGEPAVPKMRDPAKPATKEEIERKVQAILALGKRLPEPFDLKAFSDDLSDGVE